MTNVNAREMILDILLKINEEGQPGHVVLGAVLSKYQFLPRQERAFVTRICEGTLEYMLRIDYVINLYSRVAVDQMKPVIRQIMRSAVYQILFMDAVPDSAACNEAVRLTQKKGFYNLKAFVNGVLRTIVREKESIPMPAREDGVERFLSVTYSMPEELVRRWIGVYGSETTERMLIAFLKERPLTVRCRTVNDSVESIRESLEAQQVKVSAAPWLPYALYLEGYDHLLALDAFVEGRIVVQDVSSMLAAQCAAPRKGDTCIDLCAAPGGKSLHLGDLMEGYGSVDARDVSEKKVALIEEAIRRTGSINVQARVKDAAVMDVDSELSADVVLADVPCSGLGVISRKPEIKYKALSLRQPELVILQRQILCRAAEYVKPRGVLVYSTCTIAAEENEENMMWFLKNYPFVLESLDPYLPEELKCESSSLGYLQLLPGLHPCDGFFIARFRRK